MRKRCAALGIAASIFLFGSSLAQAADSMTNAEVIELVKAKLGEGTIVAAIKSTKHPAFDTSAGGLVALSKAGASDAIIQAMINAGAGGQTAAAAAPAPAALPGNSPEELVLFDGEQSSSMRYLAPNMRTAARAFGLGGVATYATLSGTRAVQRVASHQPAFVLAVPSNAQPESYYTIANFAVRSNGTREVLVGGGYMSYATGVTKDRVIAAVAEKSDDQSKAPPGYIMYKVSPAAPMAPGEYAFILYNSQVRVAGYFGSGLDSYFDFGID